MDTVLSLAGKLVTKFYDMQKTYRQLPKALTQMAQIIDDLRDIDIINEASINDKERPDIQLLRKILLEVQEEMNTVDKSLKTSTVTAFLSAGSTECTNPRLAALLDRLESAKKTVALKVSNLQLQEMKKLNISEQEKANAVVQIADPNARTFWASKLGKETLEIKWSTFTDALQSAYPELAPAIVEVLCDPVVASCLCTDGVSRRRLLARVRSNTLSGAPTIASPEHKPHGRKIPAPANIADDSLDEAVAELTRLGASALYLSVFRLDPLIASLHDNAHPPVFPQCLIDLGKSIKAEIASALALAAKTGPGAAGRALSPILNGMDAIDDDACANLSKLNDSEPKLDREDSQTSSSSSSDIRANNMATSPVLNAGTGNGVPISIIDPLLDLPSTRTGAGGGISTRSRSFALADTRAVERPASGSESKLPGAKAAEDAKAAADAAQATQQTIAEQVRAFRNWQAHTWCCGSEVSVELKSWVKPHADWVRCIAADVSRDLLVCGSRDCSISVSRLSTGEPVRDNLYGHNNVVRCVKICDILPDRFGTLSSKSPYSDGLLVSGSDDGTVLIRDLQSGFTLLELQADSPVRSVAFEQGILIAGTAAGAVIKWVIPRDVLKPPSLTPAANRGSTLDTLRSLSTLVPPLPLVDKKVFDARDRERGCNDLGADSGPSDRADGLAHDNSVFAVVLDIGRDMVISASADSFVKVWSASTGRLRRVLEGHKHELRCIAYDSAAMPLPVDQISNSDLSSSSTGTAKVSQNSAAQQTPKTHAKGASSTDISIIPVLVSGCNDGTLQRWNVFTGEALVKYTNGHSKRVYCVEVDSASDTMITGSNDCTCVIWRLSTGSILRRFDGFHSTVYSLAFLPRLNTVIFGLDAPDLFRLTLGFDAMATVREAAESKSFKSQVCLTGQDEWSTLLRSYRQTWFDFPPHIASFESHLSYKDEVRSIAAPAPSPGKVDRCSFLAAGFRSGKVYLYDNLTRMVQYDFVAHNKTIRSVYIDSTARVLVTAAEDHLIKLWSLAYDHGTGNSPRHNGIPVRDSDAPFLARNFCTLNAKAVVRKAIYDSKEDLLVCGCVNGAVIVWRQARRQPVNMVLAGHTSIVYDVAMDAKRDRIFSASDDGTVRVWKVNGDKVWKLSGHTKCCRCLSYDPNMSGLYPTGVLVSGSNDHTLRRWDLDTGNSIHTYIGHSGSIYCVKADVLSDSLVSGSDDRSIFIWRMSTGEALRQLSPHLMNGYPPSRSTVYCLEVDWTRNVVYSGGDENTVRVINFGYQEDGVVRNAVRALRMEKLFTRIGEPGTTTSFMTPLRLPGLFLQAFAHRPGVHLLFIRESVIRQRPIVLALQESLKWTRIHCNSLLDLLDKDSVYLWIIDREDNFVFCKLWKMKGRELSHGDLAQLRFVSSKLTRGIARQGGEIHWHANEGYWVFTNRSSFSGRRSDGIILGMDALHAVIELLDLCGVLDKKDRRVQVRDFGSYYMTNELESVPAAAAIGVHGGS